MHRVNYGGVGRRIPVPPTLQFPQIGSSTGLLVLETRLHDAVQRCCESTWDSLKRVHLLQTEDTDRLTEQYPGLADELSIYLNPAARQFDARRSLSRCGSEYRAVRSLAKSPDLFRGQLDRDLVLLIQRINQMLRAGQGEFRTGPVSIKPDLSGNVVEFPDHDQCRSLMHSLQFFLRENRDRYPGLSAVIALVGVVHAHPFLDGNGRTARTLFNALTATGYRSRHFLPISLLAYLSNGGFILKLRRAMYRGEWENLAQFFVDAFRLSNAGQCLDTRHSERTI